MMGIRERECPSHHCRTRFLAHFGQRNYAED